MTLRSAAYLFNRFLLRRQRLLASADHFGLKLRVRTEDVIGRHIFKYGSHERETTEFLIHALKIEDGDVIFDVGANIGWYSLILDRIAGRAKADIFSFEPDPENFSLLSENVALNNAARIHTVQCGVSDRTGTFELHLFGGSNRGRHSMLPIHGGETIPVRTVRLDEFWAEQSLAERTPRFLKLDIEGFELAALRGAGRVLDRCPLVMLEYSPRYMKTAGLAPSDLLRFMEHKGYSPQVLRDGALVATDTATLLASDRHVDIFWRRPD